MNLRDSYEARLKARSARRTGQQQLLADEVDACIGPGKLRYSLICKWIRDNDETCIGEIVTEMQANERDRRAAPIRNQATYFVNMCQTYRTSLQEITNR